MKKHVKWRKKKWFCANIYLKVAWLDTGTHDSLAEASTYIEVLEKRTGLKVACLEEIAYTQGWITKEKIIELAQPMIKNQYGQYLMRVIEN